MKSVAVAVALTLVLSCGVSAAEEEDCYALGKIPTEFRIIGRSTVVLLDETVVFDERQQKHIAEQMLSLVEHGAEIRIIAFSAYLPGRYASTVYRTKIAAPLPETQRRTMRKDHLRAFDTCLDVAVIKAKGAVKNAAQSYYARASEKVAKSAILGTLREVGEQVFPSLVGKSKRLLVVSDMLENSDVTTFYSGGGIRRIDASQEMKLVESKRLFGDFRGASVFVIGAGVTSAADRSGQNFRSVSMMGELKEFWQVYFERSNGRLTEFGQPMLLTNLGEVR